MVMMMMMMMMIRSSEVRCSLWYERWTNLPVHRLPVRTGADDPWLAAVQRCIWLVEDQCFHTEVWRSHLDLGSDHICCSVQPTGCSPVDVHSSDRRWSILCNSAVDNKKFSCCKQTVQRPILAKILSAGF